MVFGTAAGSAPNLDLAALDGCNGFRIDGINAFDNSGRPVAGAGDFNGDGIDDMIIGAFRASPGGRYWAGESYVVFGRDTALIGNFPAIFPLASLLPGGGGNGSTESS